MLSLTLVKASSELFYIARLLHAIHVRYPTALIVGVVRCRHETGERNRGVSRAARSICQVPVLVLAGLHVFSEAE